MASFVDYVFPPAVKILPPAKYKLWIVVFVLVYFASWLAREANFLEFLRFGGWLSIEASSFLLLGTIIFVLVYATMDLVITCLTFGGKDGKKMYGVGAWLKQPRAQWMYSHENLILEILARVVHILEEGFSMFDAPHPNTPNSYGIDTTLKVEHRIRPDKIEDYKRLILRIKHAVQNQNGVLERDSNGIATVWDEEEGQSPSIPHSINDSNSNPNSTTASDHKEFLDVIHVRFVNIDYLNKWMLSPRRKALMAALEPMLVQPDVVQIQSSRALPDAFSDLMTRQGGAVPKSPPKKWKVWWLTLVGYFITQKWCNSFLPYYFDQWRLAEADARLERLIFVFISTFLNSYVMTPLFLFVFDHWMQHIDLAVKNTRQPWKTLDEGFSSLWPKVMLTLTFYGGCLVAILVEKYA